MPLEFLESVQWFRRSEGGGGLEIAPPPSGARFKNTPVGRGLIKVKQYYFLMILVVHCQAYTWHKIVSSVTETILVHCGVVVPQFTS